MLEIHGLCVKMQDKIILQDFNLTINPGEIHALMGPNGSGKSTLAYVLAGKEGYEILAGSIKILGQDILNLSPEKRAHAGLFLALQYPVEIPGVSNSYFIKAALNAKLKQQGKPEVDTFEFLQQLKEKMQSLQLSEQLLNRGVNEGFSGGEKKSNEILQLMMLEPKVAVLDETDSGLDIDTLKTVASVVNSLKTSENCFLIITHYQRMLNYLNIDQVHIMINGKIVRSGDKTLAQQLENKGYIGLMSEI